MAEFNRDNPILQDKNLHNLVARQGKFSTGVQTYANAQRQSFKPPLKFYHPEFDKYFAAMLQGELGMILAQTSNSKTWLMKALAFAHAENLAKTTDFTHFTVFATLEETIEELGLAELYRHNPGVDIYADDFMSTDFIDFITQIDMEKRIIYIAPSMEFPDSLDLLTAESIMDILCYLQYHNPETGKFTDFFGLGAPLKICGVFFDYLQATADTMDGGSKEQVWQKTQRETNVLFKGARRLRTQVLMAAQALDRLKADKEWYLPNEYETMYGKYPARRVSVAISISMPSFRYPLKTRVEIENDIGALTYTVEANTLLIRFLKRRLPGRPSPARINFIAGMDFAENKFIYLKVFEAFPPMTLAEMRQAMIEKKALYGKIPKTIVMEKNEEDMYDYPDVDELDDDLF